MSCSSPNMYKTVVDTDEETSQNTIKCEHALSQIQKSPELALSHVLKLNVCPCLRLHNMSFLHRPKNTPKNTPGAHTTMNHSVFPPMSNFKVTKTEWLSTWEILKKTAKPTRKTMKTLGTVELLKPKHVYTVVDTDEETSRKHNQKRTCFEPHSKKKELALSHVLKLNVFPCLRVHNMSFLHRPKNTPKDTPGAHTIMNQWGFP